MSWKRKIHCSHCGEKGHSKLYCAIRKDYARQHPHTKIGIQVQKEAEKRILPIQCSYCEQRGHNRRTCALLKSDKSLVTLRRREFITAYKEAAKKIGLGPGALVKLPFHNYDRDSHWLLVMITGYDVEGFDFTPRYKDITASWSDRNKCLLTARIVNHNIQLPAGASVGLPEAGQRWNLVGDNLIGLLPSLFMPQAHLDAGKTMDDLYNKTRNCQTSLAAPVNRVVFPEDWGNTTYDLNHYFRFTPSRRTSSICSNRKHDSDPAWSWIYDTEQAPKFPYEEKTYHV